MPSNLTDQGPGPLVLTVNAGSSSLRLAVFRGQKLAAVASHHVEVGTDGVPDIRDWLRLQGLGPPDVVAHRVVHGGAELRAPRAIDAAVETAIERLSPLAPLHNPVALRWIRAVRNAWGPELLQVAAFDTGYYADLPAAAARYAVPDFGSGAPIRRYGFHGIAHQALWTAWHGQASGAAGGDRTISLQLGAGCSMTAAVGGKPVETSMGFTPLEGLVMATRGGDLDPGVLLYLLRERGWTAAALERMLNQEAGLLGLSGISGDLRTLLASPEQAAALAVDAYCHRIRKYLGAYLAVMGGVDAILFGGGVGENSAVIRERVLSGLEFAGVRLDPARNRDATAPAAAIHAEGSAVAIWVLAVDEARVLAEAALGILETVAKPCVL